MLTKTRKWFSRKSKKGDDAHAGFMRRATNDHTDASAMTDLAESLQKEIQSLSVEIRTLKKEREQLFRDVHDIMLSKCQAIDGTLPTPAPPFDLPSSPPPPPSKDCHSTQLSWFPKPIVTAISESSGAEMGLFGPRSRPPSLKDQPPPVISAETSTLTRTAWRKVNRRAKSINT
ncbi:hypothetical protein LshimejAT787_0900110 [Lyophyllum shimeji]|uniref:Uncharacterized protein n=1 Tax=Lyophyllum shimeji TaxID=47721 RepID=A0A9P3US38_LYOSH|nr:hypothetical protein LshimejAT787_0900110 [Lyophyllum shimeji]